MADKDKGEGLPKKEPVNMDVPSGDKFVASSLPGSAAGSKIELDSKSDETDDFSPDKPLLSPPSGGPTSPRRTSSSSSAQGYPKSPADKVRFILNQETAGSGTEQDESEIGIDILQAHALFCQMDILCHFDENEMGWKEMARWLKYEEKVEAGDRWSKPHVATTSLHALFEIRKAIADNSAVVDMSMDASHGCVHQVAEKLVSALRERKTLSEEQLEKLMDVLTRPHKHKHRKADKTKIEAKVKMQDEIDANEGKKKKKRFTKTDDLNDVSALEHMYPGGITPGDLKPYKPNKKLMGKIPGGSEVANILVGQVDFLDEPIMAFIRLGKGTLLGDLTEVSLPTRFVFLVLGPPESSSIWEYEEVGRAMAALFSDKVFCEVSYKASCRQDLVDGVDEFIDDLTVLPPSIWDPATRLEPPDKTVSMDKIRKRLLQSTRHGGEPDAINFEEAVSGDPSLVKTGKPFGGMIRDMKARYKLYLSDITDAFSVQCLASVVFLYFACVTPIVTFGGLLGTATNGQLGTMECILSGAICGIGYALFSGQPLTIVGATGPLLIFESLLYTFCIDYEIDFLAFRFWTGLWVACILLVMVVFDLSYLVKYITRFTEESFSVLISLIFIMEAFKKVIHVLDHSPVDTDTLHEAPDYLCHCVPPTPSNETGTILDDITETNTTESPIEPMVNAYNWSSLVSEDCINLWQKVVVSHDCVTPEQCQEHNWVLEGSACDDHTTTMAVPDVFFLSLFLFIATFTIAYFFRSFRNAPYFASIVRSTFADFAVLLSILICTGIDIGMGIDTPKLRVPEEFKTTVDGRGWIVNPGNLMPHWYLILLSILPAALATILIFLDQQITAVIINRKDHKLKKPPGYHLDLFVLAIEIFICSLMGLPWFVAATVRSITHVKSLIRQSEVSAPGERPTMLGVREQRVTGFFIHILIGASVLMTSILKFVPMPVLYGVFLYMGVTSLNGVQFVDRIKILAMPAKYQPDFIYLRHVPLKRVHIFTVVQIIGMIGMWLVKSIKSIAIAFPLLVLALCFLRWGMDYFFTQGELFWLDHILPETDRRKKEDDLIEDIAKEGYGETQPLTAWPEESAKGGSSEKGQKSSGGSVGKLNSKAGLQSRPKV